MVNQIVADRLARAVEGAEAIVIVAGTGLSASAGFDYSGERFTQWCKQVIGLCLTAFLQATILVAGLLVVREQGLLGLGLMLSAGEIPRVAGAFGMETSTKANMMSAVYTAQAAVNTTRSLVLAVAK